MINKSTLMNPFPGLRSFRSDEDYLFFGREEQTLELMARLQRNRFIAVVGTSGRGKSSLVRCGLLSRLQGGGMVDAGAHWEIAVMHPGGDPLRHLAEALLDAGLHDREEENALPQLLATLGRSQFGLIQAVRQAALPAGTNFLLVVDQFEEIFRYDEAGQAESELANDFIAMLREAAAQTEVPIYIVATMRSDFIGDCSRFEGLAEAVNRGEYLIPGLSREQFKSAIEGPIRVAGGQLTPRLLQRLLNDLGEEEDQLPCLQHALMRTWRVWQGRAGAPALDLEDYAQVGKMSQALSVHADEVYFGLANDRQRELCASMFKALTVEGSEKRGIRRPRRLQALCRILGVEKAELLPVIDAFRHPDVSFLTPPTSVELRDPTVIDLSHESLMRVWTRLRDWVDEEAKSVGIFRRLSETAALWRQGKTGFIRDPELSIARAWLENTRPNASWAEQYDGHFEDAMAFLHASAEAAELELRDQEAARRHELEQARALAEAERTRAEEQTRFAARLKWLVRGLGLVAMVALGAMFIAFAARREAQSNALAAREAEAKAHAAGTVADSARSGAENMVTFLLDDLYTQLEPSGRIEIVSGLARRALGYFDALPPELRDPRSNRYRAIALSRLGLALSQQGKTLEAEKPLREAEELFTRLDQQGNRGAENTIDLATVLRQQSRNAFLQNRPKPAIAIAQRGAALIEPLASAPAASAAARVELGRTMLNFGFVLMRDRQPELAMARLEQGRLIFRELMAHPGEKQRGSVLYGEICAWISELGRLMGRDKEFVALTDEALEIAGEAVAREAGNVGALRSRALLLSGKARTALDNHDYAGAEFHARQSAADWTEYLRFDPAYDTARNNRRSVMSFAGNAMRLQGRLDEAIATAKAGLREVLAYGGSPSAVRGAAFTIGLSDNLEAELGRVTDIDAALAEGNRLRQLGVAQVDAESYYRAALPVWNESIRASFQLRMGQPAAALQTALNVEMKLHALVPRSGVEAADHRNVTWVNFRTQLNACLLLKKWPEAARAGLTLVQGRPTPDDTSVDALATLAMDRALAAVALARNQQPMEAQALLEPAAAFTRARRAAGAKDYDTRYQSAVIALARGLLANSSEERTTAFRDGIAEILAMPSQPQQLRSVLELRRLIDEELAKQPPAKSTE